MPSSAFVTTINEQLAALEANSDLAAGVQLANTLLKLIGISGLATTETIIDEQVLPLPNAERYDHWFQPHPWMGGERAAFEIIDATDVPVQGKFYWLQKRSRQFVAGGVHFTENWEDADYTQTNHFKIGIDFFLTPNAQSLLVVLSNRGKLRIVELQHKLNNTQIDIFTKWQNAAAISSTAGLHATLWESFKLQSVNKDFYTGISNSFTELLQHLTTQNRSDEDAKLFASRLLGRLLFIWFLRKKGIIDESQHYFEAAGKSASSYYHRQLEHLFYNVLNTPLDERDQLDQTTQKQLFATESEAPQASLFETDTKTPYLNGGLFEAHANDWQHDPALTFPDGFFTNLYDHFEQFNFTTDESSPEYEQVAIDPEMLGRVFESLLATQVDETGQLAHKAKGTFYTPREIVSYMCRESMRNYLYNVRANDDRFKKSIDDLLDRSEHEWAGAGTNSRRDAVPKDYRSLILDALDSLTVLDPACGSGAFPMGMVQLLMKTYERLESRFDPYKTKLQIVQNNIFGVDIEPMAVEISRLRAWLSLIVDESDSHSVAPLPNLDFKFVCANSLLPLEQEVSLFADSELHQKLKDIRAKYFNARSPRNKQKLQADYYALIDTTQLAFEDDKRTHQLKSFDPFKHSGAASYFDTDQMFGIEEGFDIVIGNPPYVNVFQLSKNADFDKALYKHLYETARGAYDLYVLFFELAIKTLKPQGILTYITPNKYISAEYADALHELLESQMSLLSIVDVSQVSVFDAAVYPVVSIFQKDHKVHQLLLGKGQRDANDLITITTTVATALQPQDGAIPWSALLNQDLAWLDRFEDLKTLDDYVDSIAASFAVKDSYNIIDSIIEWTPDMQHYQKLIISSNIHKYTTTWGDKKITYLKHGFIKPVITAVDDLPITAARKQKLQQPKLVIAGMTKFLRVFYDEQATYVPSIPTIMLTGFKLSPKYLLAILNSSFMDAYYRYRFDSLSLQGGYLRVGVPQLSVMPIATTDEPTVQRVEALVDMIINAKTTGREAESIALLKQLDTIIYAIYDLTPAEITSLSTLFA